MDEAEGFGLNESERMSQNGGEGPSRTVGSPLSKGGASRLPVQPTSGDAPRVAPIPPPGRALTSSTTPTDEQPSNLQRAVSALRLALPFVQKLLPLLDGNLGTTVSNILSPHAHSQPPAPAQPVDLTPLEDGLAELHNQQRDLRNQLVEQNTSLKRVEDQLEMVREATDRNTLEQQELIEDLKGVGTKINLVVLVVMGLLVFSILLNIAMYLHIRRVLP